MINLSPNCIFLDGACPANFRNLYKGVIVVVDSNHGSLDPQYYHLAIRTRKTRTCIWKTKAGGWVRRAHSQRIPSTHFLVQPNLMLNRKEYREVSI